MKKLKKYTEWLNENSEETDRVYDVNAEWWEIWKSSINKDLYDIEEDALNKTINVSKNKKFLFIYDYGRDKVFTNESPSVLELPEEISKKEVAVATKKGKELEDDPSVEKPNPFKKKEDKEEKPDKSEEE